MTITRSSMTATYPARFMLVAAMNPCNCGFRGDRRRSCHCSTTQIRQYQSRISGPLLDRIDIHVEVPSMEYREIAGTHNSEDSKTIRERVRRARERQLDRFAGQGNLVNARMTDRQLKAYCPLDEASRQLIEMAVDKLGLSMRAATRIMKVARTIADIEGTDNIEASHVAEAIQYRSLDRRMI